MSPALAQAMFNMTPMDLVGSFKQGQQEAKLNQIRLLKGEVLQGDNPDALKELKGIAPEVALELQSKIGAQSKRELNDFIQSAGVVERMLQSGQTQGALEFANQQMQILQQTGGNTAPVQRIRDLLQSGDSGQALKEVSAFNSAIQQNKNTELTARQKEYLMAREQGFQGSILDYDMALKRASKPNVSVSVSNNQEPPLPGYSPLDKGYVFRRHPDGRVMINDQGAPEVIAAVGSPAEQAEQEKARRLQDKAETKGQYSSIVTDEIDRSIQLILDDSFRFPVTGFFAGMSSALGGTDAYQLSQFLTTISGQAAFERLQAMRDAAPTGAALGQVSDKDIKLLLGALGSFEQPQKKEELLYNLHRAREIFADPVGALRRMKGEQNAPQGTPVQQSASQNRVITVDY